jgi:ABC-type nitrate/sulfonate/bicarbonate transport system substrate-binding protein
MRYNTKICALGIALLLAMSSATLSFAAAAELSKLRFAQSGHTAASWPIYIAQEKKIFEKNGIQFENIIIQGATEGLKREPRSGSSAAIWKKFPTI